MAWLLCKPTQVGKQDSDSIFLTNCTHRVVRLMPVFVQNIVDLIVDYASLKSLMPRIERKY